VIVKLIVTAAVASLALADNAALSAQSAGGGFQVADVVMPFAFAPERSTERRGQVGIDSYHSAVGRHRVSQSAQVYRNLPAVVDPVASILVGFTRGHTVHRKRESSVNGIRGTAVSSVSESPRGVAWNVFAFSYRGNVYLWVESFRLADQTGDEYDSFLINIKRIRPR